jgi:thymidylate kinase
MKIFDQEQTDKILYLISQKNYDKLEKLMPKLKKHFETKNLLKIWFGVYLRGAVWKLPYLFKSSPLISFIGMDGAGKTTHTNRLKEILDNNKISYSVVYTGRGRNNILPIQFFGKPYKKIEEKAKKKNKKIKKSFNKKLIYTLAAPIFALDLWLRYFIRIWPKRKTKKIVITDRYLTDILLMANVPMFFKKFLYFFLPKPTKTIYLWNKAEILHKRKPDHSLEDLKRQEMLFSELNKKIKPLAIKSEKKEKTAEEVAEAVFAQIFE